MRPALTAASAALFLVALAGCAPERAGSPVHPNVMIVREFGLPLISLTIVSVVLLAIMGWIAANVKTPAVRPHPARNIHRPLEVEVS